MQSTRRGRGLEETNRRENKKKMLLWRTYKWMLKQLREHLQKWTTQSKSRQPTATIMNKSKGKTVNKKLHKNRCCCKCHKREKQKAVAKRKSLQKQVLNMSAEIETLRDRNMELLQSVHEEQREKIKLLDENEDLKIKYQSISRMYSEHVKSCFFSETEELMLAFKLPS